MRCIVKSIAQTLAAGALVFGVSFAGIAPASADTMFFGHGGGAIPDLTGSVGTFGDSLVGSNTNPSAFSATDGALSWSFASDSTTNFSNVTTDSSGGIEAFTFFAVNGTGDVLTYTFDDTNPSNDGYNIDGVNCHPCGAGSTSIPEPGTLGLLSVGILGLGFSLNRRRAA